MKKVIFEETVPTIKADLVQGIHPIGVTVGKNKVRYTLAQTVRATPSTPAKFGLLSPLNIVTQTFDGIEEFLKIASKSDWTVYVFDTESDASEFRYKWKDLNGKGNVGLTPESQDME